MNRQELIEMIRENHCLQQLFGGGDNGPFCPDYLQRALEIKDQVKLERGISSLIQYNDISELLERVTEIPEETRGQLQETCATLKETVNDVLKSIIELFSQCRHHQANRQWLETVGSN